VLTSDGEKLIDGRCYARISDTQGHLRTFLLFGQVRVQKGAKIVMHKTCSQQIDKRIHNDRSTFGNGVDVVQGIDTRLKRMKGNKFHDSGKLREIHDTRLDLRKIDADLFEFSNAKKRVARRMFIQNIQIRLRIRTDCQQWNASELQENSYHRYCFVSRDNQQ
jgi:hypothetical protein